MEFKDRIFRASRYHSTFEALSKAGVEIPDPDTSYQIKCPFHGTDNRPSARYYASSEGNASHFYCFKCRFRLMGPEITAKHENRSLESLLRSIEIKYNLPLDVKEEEESTKVDLTKLAEYCEAKLKRCRKKMSFEAFLECMELLEGAYVAGTLKAYQEASLMIDRNLNVDQL